MVDATAEGLDVHELVRLENGVPSGRTWRTPWSGLVRYDQLDRGRCSTASRACTTRRPCS
ncbi:hypothetical protein ACFQY7_26355 [Actinomadura luteofluorescens]|uniref:hypothetical protein n=1 Tax=Actinomadura luteofluorescens TaxID=46163 RepID=UPI0036403130